MKQSNLRHSVPRERCARQRCLPRSEGHSADSRSHCAVPLRSGKTGFENYKTILHRAEELGMCKMVACSLVGAVGAAACEAGCTFVHGVKSIVSFTLQTVASPTLLCPTLRPTTTAAHCRAAAATQTTTALVLPLLLVCPCVKIPMSASLPQPYRTAPGARPRRPCLPSGCYLRSSASATAAT